MLLPQSKFLFKKKAAKMPVTRTWFSAFLLLLLRCMLCELCSFIQTELYWILQLTWNDLIFSLLENRNGKAVNSTIGVTNGLCEHSRAWEHCNFFASTSRDKKNCFASSEQFREYRLASSEHFLYFPLAAIHMEILFLKIKQKMV